MRVRSKTVPNEVIYTVMDEGVSYYIGAANGYPLNAVALSKADYAPVPEEWWVRVYGKLEDPELGITTPTYRLRPVQVEGYDNPLYCVERKVSC